MPISTPGPVNPAEGAPVHIRIEAGNEQLSAYHFLPACTDLASAEGRPCVVMAHGIGATQDCGLTGFAENIAAIGCHVITFDYRHFGESTGSPRQLVSPKRQIADYLTTVAYARGLNGVDPDRIVVWGVSFSGGHVLRVVAADSRIAGAIALTPAVDGLGIMVDVLKTRGVGFLLRLATVGLRDVVAAATKRPAVLAPIVAPPGGVAALNAPGALEGMQAVAGPQWRNEFAARLVLTSGFYRPTRSAKRIAAPVLVQIADADGSAPPRAAAIAAEDARATVHHYPCDHFDVYPGARWHGRVLDDQTHFLRRSLDPLRRTPE